MLTIEVENLKLAETKLPTVGSKELLKSYSKGKILGCSKLPLQLVSGKSHSFLQAIYLCYSGHRPFVLTPDSIWLLVLQAFSVHINNDSKHFLKKYPKFTKRRKLYVNKNKVDWKNPEDCKEIINSFCDKVDNEIHDNFVERLSKRYSTTSDDEQTVFKITTMNTVKSFFEFIVVSIICGIPRIYVKGNKKDWSDLKGRLEQLREFNFDWFIDEVSEILERIIREFDEEIKDDFWINMFKIHTREEYGNPKIVDGWITSFFPYRKNGKKTDKEYFQNRSFEYVVKDINPQVVNLDFIHQLQSSEQNVLSEIPMSMIAGFVGIEQDEISLSLKPEIGWAFTENNENLPELVKENKYDILNFKNLEEFPNEILDVEEIFELYLTFDTKIFIPKEIKKIDIGSLRLYGKISRKERLKIRELYKKERTLVLVNGEDVNTTIRDRIKLFFMELSPFHLKHIDY